MRSRLAALLVAALAVSGSSMLLPQPAGASAPTTAPAIHAASFDPSSPNPVLSWDAVPGAAKYRVQIASSAASFGSPLYQVDTLGRQVTPDKNLPLATLYWRVAAEDSSGNAGPYSDTGDPDAHFTTAWNRAPQLVAPADGATLDFPTQPAVFSWRPLSGAESYELQVDNSPAFVSPQDFKPTSTSYVLSDPQTVGQTYYWRVRGISADSSVVSQWALNDDGTPRHYQFSWTAIPTNLRATTQNSNGTTDLPSLSDVTLSWDPAAGAAKYEVQISPNQDFTNNTTIDTKVDGASYTPEPTLNNASYFWRVRAIDAAAPTPHNGAWTATQQFTRVAPAAPTLVSPAPADSDPNSLATVTDVPTFAWTPVPHSAYYQLQVSTDASFSSPWLCQSNHTEWSPELTGPDTCASTSGLDKMVWQSGVVYYWRVRGIDAPSGVAGVWSSATNGAFHFVRTLGAPTYETPVDGDTSVTVPALTWDAVPGALSYRVTIKNGVGTAVVNAATTYTNSFVPTTTLAAGAYTWYVQSVDVAGSISGVPIGSAQSFTLGGSPATGASPDPTSPADPHDTRMPLLTWQAVSGATKYTVHYGQGGFELGTFTTTDPYPAFSSALIPLAPGTYSWWVDAYSSTGPLATGSTGAFTVTTVNSVAVDSLATRYQTPAHPDTDVDCTNAVCGDTPTFTWNPVANATSYQVTVANDKDFTNIAHTYTTRYPILTPRDSFLDSQAGQASYWFVSACLNFTTTPACSAGAQDPVANADAPSFKKRSNAVVTCPQDTDTPSDAGECPLAQSAPDPYRQVTFSWADFLTHNVPAAGNDPAPSPASQEAAQYRIQVSNVADFSTTLDTAVVDGTSYTPTAATYPVGPLYWRVQAIDNSGNALTWSNTQLIHRSLPAPQQQVTVDRNVSPAPGNSTVTGVPLLTWQPSAFAATYNVEVYPDTTFTPSAIIHKASGSSKFAAFSPQTSLAPGTYAWRVQAVDVNGHAGPWYTDAINTTDPNVDKSRFTFTITPPYPSLTEPADGLHLSSNNVLFRWTAVDQAAQYQWQMSPNNLFGSGTISQKTVMTAWSPIASFADGTWYWRVQALDAAGNVLASSPSRSLTKDATSPTVTAMTPTSALPITGSLTATYSENVSGVTPAAFRVVPDGGSTPVAGTVTATSNTATWTPSTPLVPGQTYSVTLTGAPADAFGNSVTPRTYTIRTDTSVDNTSPAMVERWDRDAASAALGGSYDSSSTKGSSAKYQFTGTAVSVLGTRMKSGGYAAVYLDGVKQSSTVSFYNSSTQYRKVVWSTSGLAAGPHTVQVTVLGTKPGSASDHWVYLDGFQVGTTQVDQTNAAVHEAFARVNSSSASGGSYDTASHATSGDTSGRPSYNLTFRGTGVAVYGVHSPSAGKAAVYVDNRLKSTVDLRSTSTSVTTLVGLSGLTNAVHTLRIEVVGTTTGAGSAVGVDYLRVS